ncbi:MAG: hypothetical protein LBT21_01075 [Oscillospiraceae bacterium]|jgi:hypothetical protein|nr:hypothetical protein [Oscillospiraceae bacterium]
MTRVAAAGSVGKVINRRFGRAERFFVLDPAGASIRFAEERTVQPLCNDFDHSHAAMQGTIALLADQTFCGKLCARRLFDEAL